MKIWIFKFPEIGTSGFPDFWYSGITRDVEFPISSNLKNFTFVNHICSFTSMKNTYEVLSDRHIDFTFGNHISSIIFMII